MPIYLFCTNTSDKELKSKKNHCFVNLERLKRKMKYNHIG